MLTLAPFLFVGWWMVFGKPNPTSQKGHLINPYITAQLDQSEHPQWTLAYFADDHCDLECLGKIYLLDRIRLSMGKNQDRVRVLLLTSTQFTVDKVKSMVVSDFKQLKEAINDDEIVIIDPKNQMVMSYNQNVDPRNISADLKKLLKFSRIG